MGKSTRVVALAGMIAGALPGCTNMTVSGGTEGWVQNEIIFKVDSDLEYVYRSMVITAMLSAAADANHKVRANEGNSIQAISQINGLVDSISGLYKFALAPCGAPRAFYANLALSGDIGDQCKNTSYYRSRFQSQTDAINQQIINLAKVSLATDNIKPFEEAIISGNYLTIVRSLISFGSEMLNLSTAMSGPIRQSRQERGILHATDAEVGNFAEPAKYEEIKEHLNGPGTLHKSAYNHFIAANFYEIEQRCLNIRSNIPASKLKIDEITSDIYFDGDKIKPGRSQYNCPTSFTLWKINDTDGASIASPADKIVLSVFDDKHKLVEGLNGRGQVTVVGCADGRVLKSANKNSCDKATGGSR